MWRIGWYKMIIGEDILELNYELSKNRNYFNGYRARIAQKEQLENDINKLLQKGYSIEDTAIIANCSINRVKAHMARVQTEKEDTLREMFEGEGGYFAVVKD
jgi:DNA-binding CsgD family transcriptional regulator